MAIQQTVTIVNKLGLHARAAGKLVQTSSRFSSSIRIGRDGKSVDGKSIMAVMMLAASQGTPVLLETSGPDEREAMGALTALIADRFGEGE